MTGLVERIKAALAKATGNGSDKQRPLPWEVWTSCSYRRIKTGGPRGGIEVLGAMKCSDGLLDLSMPEDRLIALVEVINDVPTLLSEIERLEAEVSRLREALEPFSQALGDVAGPRSDTWPDRETLDFDENVGFAEMITIGDLRRARAAYGAPDNG